MDTQVVIDNTAPTWTNEANVTSDNIDGAEVNATLTCSATASDLNDADLDYSYVWTNQKMVLSWVQLQHCYSMQQIPMLMMY